MQAAKEAVPEVVSTLAIMRRRQRLLISAEIPLITALCFVSSSVSHRQTWIVSASALSSWPC